MHATLPDAIMKERVSMLSDSLDILAQEGYRILAAQDFAGYPDPEQVLVHVLNTHVQPDILARREDNEDPINVFVEVSTALSGDDCGRRWQAMADWSREHHGRLLVFVHPEDEPYAREIAAHWHVDPGCVRGLARH